MPIDAVTARDYQPKSQVAIARLMNRKVPVTSRAFAALSAESKARAFRIAGIDKASLIQRVQNEISKAIRDRVSFRDLRMRLLTIFAEAGVKAPTMSHLRTITRTNMSTVDTVARDRVLLAPAVLRTFPYWKYVTVLDAGVRPDHAALHGKIFRADDPFWDKYNPPWDWGCRCSKIPVSNSDLKRLGIDLSTIEDVQREGIEANKDFAFPRDQLGKLDIAVLRSFKGDIKQFLQRRFSQADVQEAERLLAERN